MKRFSEPYTYKEYLHIQKSRSDRKFYMQRFDKDNLAFMVRHAIEAEPKFAEISNIVCLGCRWGNEYAAFKEMTFFNHKPEVYGVDINEKVKKLGSNCFAYDFNNLPDDWTDKFDAVYSNSLDHAFDVGATLAEWHRIVKPHGFMLLDISNTKLPDKSDVYGFTQEDVFLLFDDRFRVIKVWTEARQYDRFSILLEVMK